MALELSTTSIRTSTFGLPYWEYRILGDAELFFDGTKACLYRSVFYKFIDPILGTLIRK